MTLQTAERQSTTEHHIEQLTHQFKELTLPIDSLGNHVSRISSSVETLVNAAIADGEIIRALARTAEAHERRLEDLENRGQ